MPPFSSLVIFELIKLKNDGRFYDGALFCSTAAALNTAKSLYIYEMRSSPELCNKKMSRRAVFPTLPLFCSSIRWQLRSDSEVGLFLVIKARPKQLFYYPRRLDGTWEAIAAHRGFVFAVQATISAVTFTSAISGYLFVSVNMHRIEQF